MPETGIEDIIRGNGNGAGYGCGSVLISIAVFLVLIIGLGLLASYCGSCPANDNRNVQPVEQK